MNKAFTLFADGWPMTSSDDMSDIRRVYQAAFQRNDRLLVTANWTLQTAAGIQNYFGQ